MSTMITPPLPSVRRSYSVRLDFGRHHVRAYKSHHDAVNEATRVASEWFSTIRAGVAPPAELTPLTTTMLFSWWLPVERNISTKSKDYLVPSSKDALDRFKKHLVRVGVSEENLDQVMNWVTNLADLEKLNKSNHASVGTVIVDRRQAWLDLCKNNKQQPIEDVLEDVLGELLGNADGEPEATAQDLLFRAIYEAKNPKHKSNRKKQNQTAKDAKVDEESDQTVEKPKKRLLQLNQPVSNWVSRRWGSGQGQNKEAWAEFATKLACDLRKQSAPLEAETIVAIVKNIQGVPPTKISYIGRPPKLLKTLRIYEQQEQTKIDQAQLAALIEMAGKSARDALKTKDAKGSRWWSDDLKQDLAQHIAWHQDGWGEVILAAASAVIANTTNVRKRETERFTTERAISELNELANQEAHETLEAYCQERMEILDNYELRSRAIRGIKKFAQEVVKRSDQNIQEVLAEMRADPDVVLGDAHFFDWLTTHIDQLGGPEQFAKNVTNYVKLQEAHRRIASLARPALTHCDPKHHPRGVSFGENAWPAKIQNGRFEIGCSVRNGTGQPEIKQLEVKWTSARMTREFDPGDPASALPRIPRKTKLGRQTVATNDLKAVAHTSFTQFKVAYKPQGWYADLSLRLQAAGPGLRWLNRHAPKRVNSANPESWWPYQQIKPGFRVLGVDLGLRDPACWVILRTVNEEEVKKTCEKFKIAFDPKTTSVVCQKGPTYRKVLGTTDLWAVHETEGKLNPGLFSPTQPRLSNTTERILLKRIWREVNTLTQNLDKPVFSAFEKTAIRKAIRSPNKTQQPCYEYTQTFVIRKAIRCFRVLLRVQAKYTGNEDEWRRLDDKSAEFLAHINKAFFGGPSRHFKNSESKDHRKFYPGVRGSLVDRLSLLTELYRANKAYQGRPTPNQPKGTPVLEGFKQSWLYKRAEFRDQLGKQLAAELVRVALKHDCHGLAIENLGDYKPDQTRTPIENRKLSMWAWATTQGRISEACALYGLALRYVNPHGTSQTVFSTGEKGVRLDRLDPHEDRWKRRVRGAKRALKEIKPTKEGQEDRKTQLSNYKQAVLAADDWLQQEDNMPMEGERLWLPNPGGAQAGALNDPAGWQEGRTVHADLNAAANIALRGMEPGKPKPGILETADQ